MSTTDTATARRGLPVHQRKRRRIYLTAAVVLVVAAALIIWAVTSGGSGGPLPGFTVAYGQGTVANSDSILASDRPWPGPFPRT